MGFDFFPHSIIPLSLESTVPPPWDWHKLWKVKITPVKTQTRNNLLSVIACLAGRDTQEVSYTDLSKHQAVIQSDCDSCQIFAMLIFGCEILYYIAMNPQHNTIYIYR